MSTVIEDILKLLQKAKFEDDKISNYARAIRGCGLNLESMANFRSEELLTKKLSSIISSNNDVKKIVAEVLKSRDNLGFDNKSRYQDLSLKITGPSSDNLIDSKPDKPEKSPRSPEKSPRTPSKTRTTVNRPAQKRALLIGINYGGTKMQLRGCHTDVKFAKDMLINLFKFAEDEIHILLDDGKSKIPTRSNILKEFDWLVSYPAENDVYYLHFSGHGTQVPNTSGKLSGVGYDEALVPIDFEWDSKKSSWINVISTTDFEILFKHLSGTEVNFVSVFDCCHSGTAFRNLNTDGLRLGDPDIRPRYLPPNNDTRGILFPAKKFSADRSISEREQETSYPEYAILLAACRSDQTAADANINGKPCGAFSFYLYELINKTSAQETYEYFIQSTRELLQTANFSQIPQLDALQQRRNWIFMKEPETNNRKLRLNEFIIPNRAIINEIETEVYVVKVDSHDGGTKNWGDIKVSRDVMVPKKNYGVKSKEAEYESIKELVKASIKQYRLSLKV